MIKRSKVDKLGYAARHTFFDADLCKNRVSKQIFLHSAGHVIVGNFFATAGEKLNKMLYNRRNGYIYIISVCIRDGTEAK